MEPLLTPFQIRRLNRARIVLVQLGIRAQGARYENEGEVDAYDAGLLAQAADTAEDAIFDVLNIALNHLRIEEAGVGLTDVYSEARRS